MAQAFRVTSCFQFRQPLPAVQELCWHILFCSAPFAQLRVPFVEVAPLIPHGSTTSPLQRAKQSWTPLQVAHCRASAGHERSVRELVRLHAQPKPPVTQCRRHLPTQHAAHLVLALHVCAVLTRPRYNAASMRRMCVASALRGTRHMHEVRHACL